MPLHRHRFILYLLLAFLAGGLCTGLLIIGQRSAITRRPDRQYTDQHARAAETIERLEAELRRERDINRQLREHNNRARNLTAELTSATASNVRNLSDAVSLIGEIRAKVKILADFYAGGDSGDGGN